MGKKKTITSYKDLMDTAKENMAQLMSGEMSETQWEELFAASSMNISDFVGKRYVGLSDYDMEMVHDFKVMAARLENIEESPRKKAAQIMLEQYEQAFEQHLDRTFESHVFVECSKMFMERNVYEISPEVKRQVREEEPRQREAKSRQTSEMVAYQSLMRSFFKDGAVIEAEHPLQEDVEAGERVLARLGQALPPGPEYEVYKTMAGYQNQRAMRMEPRSVTMVMEPNAITDVSVDNYVSKIRAPRPKKLDIEWGVSTFDTMMEGLYSMDELETLKRDNKDFFDTMFLDGRPLKEVIPPRDIEDTASYIRRAKCEAVAFALEGKGKLDICPYEKRGEGYAYREPIPVKVKVNLKEKHSGLKKFLHFLHLGPGSQKDKAEKLSLSELQEETRHDSIRNHIRELAQREEQSQRMKTVIEEEAESVHKADQAFFGFLGKNPDEIRDRLRLELGEEPDSTLKTMHRATTRVSVVQAYALSKGLSLDEIISDDPSLNARKEAIGREFIERTRVQSRESFEKEHGGEADYEQYLNGRSQEAFKVFEEIHQSVCQVPLDFFPDMKMETLEENYKKLMFCRTISQDFVQSASNRVIAVNEPRFGNMFEDLRPLGALDCAATYCDYVASVAYAEPWYSRQGDKATLAKGLSSKENLERFLKDTKGMRTMGELSSVIDKKWIEYEQVLTYDLSTQVQDYPGFSQCADYMRTGQKPVCLFHEGKGYEVGSPSAIAKKSDAMSWKDFEVLDKKDFAKDGAGPQRKPQPLKLEKETVKKAAQPVRKR